MEGGKIVPRCLLHWTVWGPVSVLRKEWEMERGWWGLAHQLRVGVVACVLEIEISTIFKIVRSLNLLALRRRIFIIPGTGLLI